jgi:hypothetical protein
MKFMLMMNAPAGKGDWDVADWSPDDFKAHIAFMAKFHTELKTEGVLVGSEGLAMPKQARIVRAGKTGAPEVTDGPFAESKEFWPATGSSTWRHRSRPTASPHARPLRRDRVASR